MCSGDALVGDMLNMCFVLLQLLSSRNIAGEVLLQFCNDILQWNVAVEYCSVILHLSVC